ncbi:MAG: RES family NAD+ phosphorylase [Stellaceae bacterium]
MVAPGRRHDRALLDALEAIEAERFSDEVWRVVRQGRDALRGSAAGGRWSPPGEFEVLYTSLSRAGALAEIGYRLSLEPIWPSRIRHDLHRIGARTARSLHFARVAELVPLGVDAAKYGSFDYSVTQAIAAAARFLEFDGLIVPSARYDCANIVLFLDRASDGNRLELLGTEDVDWEAWRKRVARPRRAEFGPMLNRNRAGSTRRPRARLSHPCQPNGRSGRI